ncbi:branched-chain amino acid ABC transporter permease [Xanthobacter sp. AM11]|uniref:branched-chain amino acid ABC transporter permease n=1 Tax=Xanthobacter sp. AM11 TaxID=3380643 RepID=UPI0039BF5408
MAERHAKHPVAVGLGAIAASAAWVVLLLKGEHQWEVAVVGALALALGWLLRRRALARPLAAAFTTHEGLMGAAAIVAVLAVAFVFLDDHFNLLMLASVLLTATVCIGLNVQTGDAGVVNFAGASIYGAGAYAGAVVVQSGLPHILAFPFAALVAGVMGAILVLPLCRARGHYAAVVTIAFAMLFKGFLEVNDTLGGPQGLQVRGIDLFGWRPNRPFEMLGLEVSQYAVYLVAALALLAASMVLTQRLERSWAGLTLDMVRADETAAACFGIRPAVWKAIAFVFGSVLAGLAGALYAFMAGFIAPSNFTLGDSLILISIVLLGGLGNHWGTLIACLVVVLVPEKLQVLQEYRFLIFSALVVLVLLFRPQGLIPRGARLSAGVAQ